MSILSKFDGFDFPIRESDGYWNLTVMCSAHGKLFADFLRRKSAKAYLEALSSAMGIPIAELIQIKEGGINQGTWGHPRVALKLAAWCSPRFEVWVYTVIEKLLQDGQVTLENEIESLRQSLDSVHAQIDRMWDDSLLNDIEIRYGEYLEEIGD